MSMFKSLKPQTQKFHKRLQAVAFCVSTLRAFVRALHLFIHTHLDPRNQKKKQQQAVHVSQLQ